MELPEYKAPSIRKAFVSMCQRGWSFIVKAGTIILVCNFVVHLMQNFGWNLQPVEDASSSILATIATPFAYIFAPIIGYVSWQLAAATITGFIAKENVVGTLAVCFAISNLGDGADAAETALAFGQGSGDAMVAVAGLAYLMFNLFTPPCFAAIGAMNAELKSKKWLFGGIGLQLAMGYSVSFVTFFFGTLFTGGSFGDMWMPIVGWTIVAAIVAVLLVLIVRKDKQLKAEKAEIKNQKKEKVNV